MPPSPYPYIGQTHDDLYWREEIHTKYTVPTKAISIQRGKKIT